MRAPREQEVWIVLGLVRDPELDEPITDLNFVTEVQVSEHHVLVRLRLPTYFCAPNFAYLMVADAHDVVSRLSWATDVTVRLEDHFASDEINGGVADDAGFSGSFPGQSEGELDELRATFQRKAHTACLERSCRSLLDAGWEVEGLSRARLSDLPAGAAKDALLRRRSEIGLDSEPGDPLVVDATGRPVTDVHKHLRFAKTVRVSIDGNGIFCRGLLATRYGDESGPGTLSGVIPVTDLWRRAS
ncbi:iron-sulfur cluster assembly protein [Kineosporia rhizophila]|uniref:iron-sulfur cluster assembly protein n=1 Tax=Kineosporia rhizophila TaxID=84633 RepID=UPI000AA1E898|nr:iron-sulfur cluster assembly protein [Kineosporia rhizophila]